MNVVGEVGNWIFNFLTSRVQHVMVGNKLSSPSPIKSGVPQGTVLGPILFLVYIQSISEIGLNSLLASFADDSKILHKIISDDDIHSLQNDLNKLFSWETASNMKFNLKKFVWVQYGRNQDLKHNYNYFSDEYGDIIVPSQSTRDLGIIINDDANYNTHINILCSKVSQKVGWLLRNFYNRSPQFMKWLWLTYIQPKIDYCSQLYGPNSGPMLLKLENLLKSFTKRIDGFRNKSYWDRLKALDLSSIGRRIQRYKCIYTWKIVNGLVNNCNLSWSYNEYTGTIINTISVGKYYKSLRSQSFQWIGPRLFNSLPRHIRDCKLPLSDFKSLLNEFLRQVPDCPVTRTLTPVPMDPHDCSPSNCITHWILYLKLSDRSGGKHSNS